MYNSISSEFKDKSKYLTNQTIYIGLPIFYFGVGVLLIYLLKWDIFNPFYLFFVFFGVITFLILISYYGLILKTVKSEKEFSWKKSWRILKMINFYTETVHNKDIDLLKNILKDYGVNTRPKVLEVLRHYQCLLPRKIISGGHLLSILALTIATLALLFQDSIYNSENKLFMVFFVILMVIAIYMLIDFLNKNFFRVLGVDALNERIEMAVSEIWIHSLIK